MSNGIYWVKGPWTGRLAITARPRGGDWLADNLRDWRQEGVAAVVSLLTSDEEREFKLEAEGREATVQGMKFLSVPVRDRQVPESEAELQFALQEAGAALGSGKNVLVHCRQGIGRSGLFAACLLVDQGWSPEAATKQLSSVRGTSVPETAEQQQWIDNYASRSHAAHSYAGSKRKAV
ncbi:MAG: dual specificity protein phosphatase family protein [Candidatus Korobacteraceae bacterium]